MGMENSRSCPINLGYILIVPTKESLHVSRLKFMGRLCESFQVRDTERGSSGRKDVHLRISLAKRAECGESV